MRKKLPSIDEYDEGWEEKEKIPQDLLALSELIGQKFENIPEGNMKRIWKKELNLLVNTYNERVGFKAFKNVY